METATMTTPTPLTREKIEEIRAFVNGTGYSGFNHAATASRLVQAGEYLTDLLSENEKLRLEFVAQSLLIDDLKGELAFYKYEDLAQRFYQENGKGMMAPGKSDPRGYHTFEERSEAWQKWLEERGDVNPLDSVLASAKAEGIEQAAKWCKQQAEFHRELQLVDSYDKGIARGFEAAADGLRSLPIHRH